MKLQELKRNLTANEIDFRVGTVIVKTKAWATILAYKDARVDMNILDTVVGQENWQVKFREEKDCIVASIGIKIDGEWVWKEGNGINTDFEAQKGGYSDAQKRAGFQWGIGRSLYNFPQIFIELKPDEYNEQTKKATAKLRPKDWNWDITYKGDEVVKLIAADKNGEIRFKYETK